ncbi:MAG: peptidylprolyl isomerase [Polyangiaceae bacterium]|jgi:peptidyl-prolyl cis-trans isomerase A (cyclophilin A)
MKASLRMVMLALAPLASTACAKNEPEPTPTAANTTAAPTVAPTPPAPALTSSGPLASTLHPMLLDPANAKDTAPAVFKAKFTTTNGDFVVEVHKDWAPIGADRFYNLVKLGFYDDTRFFRVVDGFMVQFGISGDPAVNAKWQDSAIADESGKQSNKKGFITYAQRNTPGSRTTQVFINLVDNARLDGMHFVPFGQVVQGMDVVDSLYKGYGEGTDQGRIQAQGNAYLDARFPKLDAIKHAEIVK